jgi:DNA-binding NtrC family response regulator
MNQLNILILDDEKGIRKELKDFFLLYEYNVFTAGLPSEAFEILKLNEINIMILDIQLPEMDGIEVLQKVKHDFPNTEVLMITGHGDQDAVIQSLRLGAFDFFKKPFRAIELKTAIERTQKFITLNNKLQKMSNSYSMITDVLLKEVGTTIVGQSKEIKKVLTLIAKVAEFDNTSVLITGESGTGKELVARSIHLLSNRKKTMFYPVNCSAIPENLFESEFFGHKRGSFTGALQDKAGWFETADKGTLFLDEIADLPISQQSKLLRVLEDNKVRRIGSMRETEVDVRIISATNKDIEKLAENDNFRSDLLHRFNSFVIHIPPLRERKEDIPILAEHFAQLFSEKMRKPIVGIENKVFNSLQNHNFKGNIRELKNIIERAVILTDSDKLRLQDFPIKKTNILSNETETGFSLIPENLDLALAEKKLIQKALQKAGNNKTKAAESLNISWYALDRKMKKHKI